MEITSNTTGMTAGVCLATDKDGKDHYVVVLKGTFHVQTGGIAVLADEQEPTVYCDLYNGEPGISSVKYECDFARVKPSLDVVVNGAAFAPGGKPVQRMTVELQIGLLTKRIEVFGNRHWEASLLGTWPTPPDFFVEMPLVYERAFGGQDSSHDDPQQHRAALRNLVGVGFHTNSDLQSIDGTPLPNLEVPSALISNWNDKPVPIGFGVVSRNWVPRRQWAGTYGEAWLEERCPLLPFDFDDRFYSTAPEDQQLDTSGNGVFVLCRNMRPDGDFYFATPEIHPDVIFRFRNRSVVVASTLDTIIVEPTASRILMTWRASTPAQRKLNALRDILVGTHSRGFLRAQERGKAYIDRARR